MSDSEDEMKRRLKEEIDRMDSKTLTNMRDSKSSFLGWVKETIKRIWQNIVDSVIETVSDWLWGKISNRG